MSVTQTAIGAGIILAVGTAVLQAILPAPVPLTVHEQSFADGYVTLDVTVASRQDFYFVTWAASVVDAETGRAVCNGAGARNVPAGRTAFTMPKEEWLGNTNCTLDAGTEYVLWGSYDWGDGQVRAQSEPFTP